MAFKLDTLARATFNSVPEMSWERVGMTHSIELPKVAKDIIAYTIGDQIGKGTTGVIHRVVDYNRVYKIIPFAAFGDGHEVLVHKIASQLGIAPQFYGACVATSRNQSEIIIEMDLAENTLSDWIELYRDVRNANRVERKDDSLNSDRDETMATLRNKN